MPGSPWHTLCGRAADHSERRSWGLPLEDRCPTCVARVAEDVARRAREGRRPHVTAYAVRALLTTRQAADSLGIAQATVRQAIARGSLDAWRMGSDWLIAEPEVERYRARTDGRSGRPRGG